MNRFEIFTFNNQPYWLFFVREFSHLCTDHGNHSSREHFPRFSLSQKARRQCDVNGAAGTSGWKTPPVFQNNFHNIQACRRDFLLPAGKCPPVLFPLNCPLAASDVRSTTKQKLPSRVIRHRLPFGFYYSRSHDLLHLYTHERNDTLL